MISSLPLLLLAAALPAPPPLPAPAPAAVVVERRLAVMGTELELRVEAPTRAAGLAAGERAVEALEAVEMRLSTWRPDSELARFNRAPVGRPVPLSPELAADLEAARRCADLSKGAFDPTVGALVRAWGLRSGGRRPDGLEKARALAATGLDGLDLPGDGTAVRRHPGVIIEEGGFGKGVGLAAAMVALAGYGDVVRARLDLGGQAAVWGPAAGEGWELAVADPRDRRRPVVALTLGGGSLATSGNSERGLRIGGERRGHLLDPRTGEPAPDFGSLTVWAPDPVLADCLSTGLYVLGPEAAFEWAADHPGFEVLVIQPRPGGLVARMTPGLAPRAQALVDGIKLEAAMGREASKDAFERASKDADEEALRVDAGGRRPADHP